MKNRKGQTAIEYIFLVAIMAAVIFSIISKFRTFFTRGIENCANNQTNVICVILNNFGQDNFRTFAVHGIRKNSL